MAVRLPSYPTRWLSVVQKYTKTTKYVHNNFYNVQKSSKDASMSNAYIANITTLTQEQQTAFESIISIIETRVTSVLQSYNIQDYMISLTGAAGTGKTFLTVQIIKHLIEKYSDTEYGGSFQQNFVVTAPTHKALSVIAQML